MGLEKFRKIEKDKKDKDYYINISIVIHEYNKSKNIYKELMKEWLKEK